MVLVIDGCLFGVLGKFLVVIYMMLEVLCGGLLVCVCEGDIIWMDGEVGMLDVLVDLVEWVVCMLVLNMVLVVYDLGCNLFVMNCCLVGLVD